MWYLSAYPKGIKDVGVFFSSVDPILMFLMRALRSLGHGCVQEVKNDINTVRFLTQTARFVS